MTEDTESNIIKGLIVTIPGADVKAIWEDKAKHHDERAKVYREQLQKLAAADIRPTDKGDEIEVGVAGGKFSNSLSAKNAADDTVDKILKHENSAREARFRARFTDTSKLFRLDNEDLYKLGILHNRY